MTYTTRKTLLLKVRDGDEISWEEFYRLYKPLIFSFCAHFSLSESDRADVLQQVMTSIFQKNILKRYNMDQAPPELHFRYDRARGRFRHYLLGIVRNHCLKVLRDRKQKLVTVDLEDSVLFADDLFEAAWAKEWRRHQEEQALAELKLRVDPATYQAFEMYGIQNRPWKEVAAFLGMSRSSVYTAKSRCAAMLKQILREQDELL